MTRDYKTLLYRYKEYVLEGKMPDSPSESITKNQASMANTLQVNNSVPGLDLHRPRSPRMGQSPTAPESTQLISNQTHPNLSNDDGNGTSNGASPNKIRQQAAKVKRFLTTLQQFAADNSNEAGDRVHSLILGLLSNALSVEEFHSKIQAVTNYPLKPFAVPFLKCHLPALQAELLQFSKNSKQPPSEQHLWLLAEPPPPAPPPTNSNHPHHRHSVRKSSFLEPPFLDIINIKDNNNSWNGTTKRRSPSLSSQTSNTRNLEQNYAETNGDCYPPSAKRPHLSPLEHSPRHTRLSGSPGPVMSSSASYNLRPDNETSPMHYSFFSRDRLDRYERLERDFCRPFYGNFPRELADDRDGDEEWRNIHTMLNCILGMVEKTKRALAILQHRSFSERSEVSSWSRFRHLESELDLKKASCRTPPDVVAHFKVAAEDRVSVVRRRAEDAVNEVKRQAVVELQKAVSVAESKANELVAVERLKMERLISEAKKQASEDALAQVHQQQESTENCWNCGRKANETCSGCNIARYCGSFCQHKDWEHHHKVCRGQSSSNSPPAAIAVSNLDRCSPSPGRSCLLDLKLIKTDEDSE